MPKERSNELQAQKMKIGNSFTKIFQPALNSKWIQRLQQMADDFLDSNFKQYECADIREIGDPVLAACVYELLRYQYSNKFDLTPKEMAEKIVIYALAITMESVSRKSNFGLKPPSLDNIFSVERILGYRKIRPEFIDLIII
jgi:hypothetical protein